MDQSPLLRGFPVAEPRLLLSCRLGSEGMLSHCFTSRDPGHQWEITMASQHFSQGVDFSSVALYVALVVRCLCPAYAVPLLAGDLALWNA